MAHKRHSFHLQDRILCVNLFLHLYENVKEVSFDFFSIYNGNILVCYHILNNCCPLLVQDHLIIP